MTNSNTIVWRSAMLILIGVSIALAVRNRLGNPGVDTEAMLDVSVSIKTISFVHTDSVGDSVWGASVGSGFLVSTQGCEVWTNQHVVEDAAIIEVFPRGWKSSRGIPAQVVNSSPHADIALLKMQSCAGIPQAPIGDSNTVRAGDETYAVGNPLGQNPDSISRGIISNTQRHVRDASTYLQTDAAINPGNSGGALFNHKGEIIGINTAIATTGDGVNTGIGYAIPINYANRVTQALRRGHPSWGDAGINQYFSSLSADEAELFHVPKGYSAVILTGTPAKGAAVGKLFSHDVIYRINRKSVASAAQARRIITRLGAGQNVEFDIVRNGRSLTVGLTLDDGWVASEPRQLAEYYSGYLGMTLEMWQDKDGERGRIKSPVITKVQSLGPAHKAHIASSQRAMVRNGPMWAAFMLDVKTITGVVVNGLYHPVKDVASVRDSVQQAYNSGHSLLLEIQVWRRNSPMKLNLPLKPVGTAFYKITPAMTTAHKPVNEGDGVTQVSRLDSAVGTIAYRGF